MAYAQRHSMSNSFLTPEEIRETAYRINENYDRFQNHVRTMKRNEEMTNSTKNINTLVNRRDGILLSIFGGTITGILIVAAEHFLINRHR